MGRKCRVNDGVSVIAGNLCESIRVNQMKNRGWCSKGRGWSLLWRRERRARCVGGEWQRGSGGEVLGDEVDWELGGQRIGGRSLERPKPPR